MEHSGTPKIYLKEYFFLVWIQNGQWFPKFGDVEIEKFRKERLFQKSLFQKSSRCKWCNIDKTVISKDPSHAKKSCEYLAGNKNNEEIKLLSVLLPRMGGCLKNIDIPNVMNFLIQAK